MLLLDQHPHNKSIMIALLGNPNAGKSTLINHLLGFDLTIVSSKPQTTRNQFHCALTIDRTEIVLVDTPGVHKSGQELNKRMNGQAILGSEGVDINFLLIDQSIPIIEQVKEFLSNFQGQLSRTWIIFTKSDLQANSAEFLIKSFEEIKELIPSAEKFFDLSATTGENVHVLTGAICDAAQPGPHLYPKGDVSNKSQRFFASEYIREQAFNLLKEELPYEMAVVIEEFKDADMESVDEKFHSSRISAAILVNRPSQRGIVVGKGGSLIKTIGANARKKIEAMVGNKVHLNLHVKVAPKWFRNNYILDELDLPRTQESARVWRKQ